MKKIFNLFIIILLMGVCQTGFAQLAGEWTDDNGHCYKIREVGNQVYWTMNGGSKVVNVFSGLREGDIINGEWKFMPGGERKGNGTLSIRVESNDRMVKIAETGNYGASVWLRQACVIKDKISLVGRWTWEAKCGAKIVVQSEFTITSEDANGSFTGQMSDPDGAHMGSIKGTLRGSKIRIVRMIARGHQQIWCGTYDSSNNTLSGTVSDPYHENCTFIARKI